ncbi:RmlC-like cupin domain-containing protein [Fomes fomentarius]|nr:RmlC-like cupin domain-containing protein [Fomes fomentarius]
MTRILLPLVPLVAAFLFSGVAIAAPASAASSAAAAVPLSAASGVVGSAMSGAIVPVASGAVSSLASSPLASPRTSAVASSAIGPPPPAATAPLASDDPNPILFLPDTGIIPTAQRGQLGANVIGPQNVPIDRQNADLLAPPTTDHGSVMNAKWPFALSHNRLQTGGWARTQNRDQMPIAQSIAGVNMRLLPGAIRELHWHTTSEWAYILKGTVQVTAINTDGQNFLGTVNPGDLWYFPAGMPHSLQATNDTEDGAEFIIAFDDGAFDEDSTFLLTDWLAHVPKEVIAKNFQTSVSAFDRVPNQQLYIFPGVPPADNARAPPSPQGTIPDPFTFALSKIKPTQLSGGTVKIVDDKMFKAATGISAIEVTVEPGAMRELHWHPNADEWSFFISGQGRMTIFATNGNARTFDYEAGDVGFVPKSFGHHVENTGNDTLHFLEIFKSGTVQDVSLSQWLALTPPELVQAHLALPDDVLSKLSNFRKKAIVVGPQ